MARSAPGATAGRTTSTPTSGAVCQRNGAHGFYLNVNGCPDCRQEREERMVWDVFENCYVTYDYWQWVNQRGKYAK